MSATATLNTTDFVSIDPELTNAIVGSVSSALGMCDMKARCVSLASVPGNDTGLVTGMIGVHGKVSGFITVNMSEDVGVKAVGGLLQEEHDRLSSQVVDGIGEITNIIVGGIKSSVAGGPWSFSHITVPSVIVGKGYSIAYSRGLTFINATFEYEDPEIVMLQDRLLQVSISLLQL